MTDKYLFLILKRALTGAKKSNKNHNRYSRERKRDEYKQSRGIIDGLSQLITLKIIKRVRSDEKAI